MFSTLPKGVTSITESNRPSLSVVIPCLNEALTIEACVIKAKQTLDRHLIPGEVVVADNGSTDGSQALAIAAGARVISALEKGYGGALKGGIAATTTDFVIMGDADDTYDFTELPRLYDKLLEGNDLVMGNRFKGGIKPGAMPVLHRYLGTPVLSFIGRLLFNIEKVGDFNCGLRGFSRESYQKWNVRSTGMEFASEMIVKAALNGSKIAEVPVSLSPDRRNRPPHLKTWQDGWRHLHFFLTHSPRWLFIYPGLFLLFFGIVGIILLMPQERVVGNIRFDIHTLGYSTAAVLIGGQFVSMGVLAAIHGIRTGTYLPQRWLIDISEFWVTSKGIFLGVGLVVIGLGLGLFNLFSWQQQDFGDLNPSFSMRTLLGSLLLLITGFQCLLTSFLISILAYPNE